jgi:hypothetical protein
VALANDSIDVTPGVGASVATHTVASKEHQVTMLAGDTGHIVGTLPTYYFVTAPAPVGADKLYLDLFNATGSLKIVDIRGLWIIPKTDVVVTGALAIRIDLYRTSAVGTGGSTMAYKSATRDNAAGTIFPSDTGNAALPAQITARVNPTGGATISEWCFPTYALGEESATSQAYMTQYQNLMPVLFFGQKFVLNENQGLLVKQGSVAATGTIHILGAFTVE